MIDQKPHIVFLVATYDYPSPRNVRVKNLVPYLKDQYRITILTLSSAVRRVETEVIDGITVTRVPYSWISKNVSNKRYSDKQLNGVILKISRVASFLLKRYYLFPDPWVIEQKRLTRALSELREAPSVVVASMMPFSMADVLYQYRSAKDSDASIPVVLDIGDPLAHNVVQSGRRSHAKLVQYESRILSSCDHVIVTNAATADHYADAFQLNSTRISVIPQGAVAPSWVNERRAFSNNKTVDIRYAGLFIQDIRDPRLLFSTLNQFADSISLTACGGIDQCFITGNEHINFKGWLAEDEVCAFYKDADCLLYFDNKRGLQTSGKIYELLATRKPILFCYDNEDSPVKKECEKFGQIIFMKNEAAAIEKGLEALRQSLEQALMWLTSHDGQSYTIDQFSWQERGARFSVVLEQVLDGSGGSGTS